MNFFSSSTSRLIIPRWKRPDTQTAQQETLLSNCKYASTEGRFSIIDKRRKESTSMESSDSSSDEDFNSKEKKGIFTETKYDHRVSFRSAAPTTKPSKQQFQSDLKKGKQMNGSRFRIKSFPNSVRDHLKDTR
uniref:DUF4005 domain-containing protein n=1 Tax=Setaria digitata TaxID=48799 RepID=A0A915Q6C6_9BILA